MKNSGEQTIETVRGQGVTISIIVLTGYLEDKDVEHLIGIGAIRVLEKPIKVPQLVSSISYGSAKNTKATTTKPPPTEYSTTPLQNQRGVGRNTAETLGTIGQIPGYHQAGSTTWLHQLQPLGPTRYHLSKHERSRLIALE